MKSILFSLGIIFFYLSLVSWPVRTVQFNIEKRNNNDLNKLLNILTRQKKSEEQKQPQQQQDPMNSLVKLAEPLLLNSTTSAENNEDLFAYLFKIESKPEDIDGSDKNVLFSSVSSSSLAPKCTR